MDDGVTTTEFLMVAPVLALLLQEWEDQGKGLHGSTA